MVALILASIVKFLEIYGYILIVRILLSWFQGAEWAFNIISFLSPITDPIIPPLGGIDLSAILAILALQLLQGLFASSAAQAYAYFGGF